MSELRGEEMRVRFLLLSLSMIVLIGLSGCLGMLMAHSPATRGTWAGTLEMRPMSTASGETVQVPILAIADGPALEQTYRPREVALVKGGSTVLAVDQSLTHQRVEVTGTMSNCWRHSGANVPLMDAGHSAYTLAISVNGKVSRSNAP